MTKRVVGTTEAIANLLLKLHHAEDVSRHELACCAIAAACGFAANTIGMIEAKRITKATMESLDEMVLQACPFPAAGNDDDEPPRAA